MNPLICLSRIRAISAFSDVSAGTTTGFHWSSTSRSTSGWAMAPVWSTISTLAPSAPRPAISAGISTIATMPTGPSSVIATMVVKEPNTQTSRLRCQ